LCVPDPWHGFEPRLGGVGVKGEHQGLRPGGERRGDGGVGGVFLAFHGDPLHAEADCHGEALHAGYRRVKEQTRLAADDGAIEDGTAEEKNGKQQPFALHAIAGTTEPHGFGTARDEGPGARQHRQTARARQGDATRQQGLLRPLSFGVTP
jgi:hypothetical protein